MATLTDASVPGRERIATLDVLRGVAVGGILLANVFVFFGLFLISPDRAAALPTAALDRTAEFLEHVFVEGKFYSIFSLLFGIGFGVQLSRGGQFAVPRFRRRLRILLAIGAVHALLLWAGDILMLYALLGFTLPWFARRSDRALARWTMGLLAIPTGVYALGLAVWTLVGSGAAAAASGGADVPPDILARLTALGTGGVGDAFIGNLLLLAGRWADLFVSLRFPKVLGMFVLGLLAVRQGIALHPAAHPATLRRWCRFGWFIGLPCNVIGALAFSEWAYLPPSFGGLVGVASQAIGFPLLALGYAATVALAVSRGHRLLIQIAPVGRMALTNYLLHSVVCVVLSYGFGFGLWQRIGASTAMAIALAIVAVQILFSRWWFAHYAYGPLEWIWRRLTYGTPLSLRR